MPASSLFPGVATGPGCILPRFDPCLCVQLAFTQIGVEAHLVEQGRVDAIPLKLIVIKFHR